MSKQVPVVLPLKSLANAKERLATALNTEQRQALCLAMLDDTLSAVRACPKVHDVWLLTADAGLAQERNTQHIADPGGDLSAAVTHAAHQFEALGYEHLLVLHADLPLLDTNALDTIIDAHHRLRTRDKRCVSIATDLNRQGSNALLCSPPTAMRFAYGQHSLKAHLDFTRSAAMEAQTLDLAPIATDIDTAEDLDKLRLVLKNKPNGITHTRRFLDNL